MTSSSQLPNSDEIMKKVKALIDDGHLRKGLKKLEIVLEQGVEYQESEFDWLDSDFTQEETVLINKFCKHYIRILLKQGQWKLAANIVKKTLTRDKDYKSYLLLGDIYKSQNMWSESLENYLNSVKINSNNTGIYQRLRKIIKLGDFNQDEWSKLEDLLHNFMEMDPNNTFASSNYGDVLSRLGKIDEAVKCYRTICYQKNLAKKTQWVLEHWSNHASSGPNFIIIGVRKCGTTSLYHYIKQHPQVLEASRKEIKYFNNDDKFKLGTRWYLSHFPPIPDTSDYITGEASPVYFNHPKVSKRMARKFPNIKLILVLRNPVDRAISEFHFKVRRGGEFREIRPVIENELNNFADIDSLAAAKKRDSDSRILLGGLYIDYLERWMEHFPKEQILILKTEDLANKPDRVMCNIFEYLELPDYQISQYEKKNVGNYNSVDEDLKTRLNEFYYPHNKKLEEYMSMNFNWN